MPPISSASPEIPISNFFAPLAKQAVGCRDPSAERAPSLLEAVTVTAGEADLKNTRSVFPLQRPLSTLPSAVALQGGREADITCAPVDNRSAPFPQGEVEHCRTHLSPTRSALPSPQRRQLPSQPVPTTGTLEGTLLITCLLEVPSNSLESSVQGRGSSPHTLHLVLTHSQQKHSSLPPMDSVCSG